LYKEEDKAAYKILTRLGKSKSHPPLIGSQEEIHKFLRLLIVSQKMKEYRKFWNIALTEFQKKEVCIREILSKSEHLKILRGVDSWAIFLQDKRLCMLVDEFQDATIVFVGTHDETSEFFVRFVLSQLLQDWRGPLMAVLVTCLEQKKVAIAQMNRLLETWDYTNIF